jgi:hypothetical protein
MKIYVAQGFWKLIGNRRGKNKGPRGNRQNLANGIYIGIPVYTDYPLNKNDLVQGRVYDEPCVRAPVRQVELLGWDHNKYCLIKFEDSIFEIKLWYCHLHKDKGADHSDRSVYKYQKAFPNVDRDVYKHVGIL